MYNNICGMGIIVSGTIRMRTKKALTQGVRA